MTCKMRHLEVEEVLDWLEPWMRSTQLVRAMGGSMKYAYLGSWAEAKERHSKGTFPADDIYHHLDDVLGRTSIGMWLCYMLCLHYTHMHFLCSLAFPLQRFREGANRKDMSKLAGLFSDSTRPHTS